MYCQARATLSVLESLSVRREIIHLLLFLSFEGCFCREAVALPAPTLGWHSTAQGSLGIADAYSLSVEISLSLEIHLGKLVEWSRMPNLSVCPPSTW